MNHTKYDSIMNLSVVPQLFYPELLKVPEITEILEYLST